VRHLPLILLMFLSTFSAISIAQTSRPFVLDHTQVLDFHSQSNGKDYEIYIRLPDGYGTQPNKKYPLVLLTDGYYAFPLVSAINWRMTERHDEYQQAILVGISYSKGDDINLSRTRDYTPSFSPNEKFNSSKLAQAQSGKADAFIGFIGNEVLPSLLKTYAIDPNKKIYAGHSYGGLLGTYILLTQPSLFDIYLIGSPSLWYDTRVMFKLEESYAKTHKDLRAKVFMATGAEENDAEHSMVQNMFAFEKALKERNYPHLEISAKSLPEEGHLSGYPAFITQGLRWALPIQSQ
jgi:predicted alpha/beta superfamily hydrolase